MLLRGLLFLGLFANGLTLHCDTCFDKCSCYFSPVQEACPPRMLCYTVNDVMGRPIRKGCAHDCHSFGGQCSRCDTELCNRTPRGAYTPSGYEDCDTSGAGTGSEWGGSHIGGGGVYGGGDSGIGQGAGVYGNSGSGIGQGAGVYGNGGSGIGQGAGVDEYGRYGNQGQIGGGVYGGGGSGIGQGAGVDQYGRYPPQNQGIGQGVGVYGNQRPPAIGGGVYPGRGSASSITASVVVVLTAGFVMI
ncbi:hypothetical protein L596_025381 [Steinernema carpocapsae]|uniref:4Fe-4S ferredoxin-type domain-containing protein n=1 Tax=Steinernema carpocapsae TaxID=34508 RepID=A0A4U5M7L8_STECR|nr:hypothetical protein L596_025381 [Steinernema carpocapsae]